MNRNVPILFAHSWPVTNHQIAGGGCLYGAFFVKASNLAPLLFKRFADYGRRTDAGTFQDVPRGARYDRRHRAACLYSVDHKDPNHDAIIRIGDEAPGRRVHST